MLIHVETRAEANPSARRFAWSTIRARCAGWGTPKELSLSVARLWCYARAYANKPFSRTHPSLYEAYVVGQQARSCRLPP